MASASLGSLLTFSHLLAEPLPGLREPAPAPVAPAPSAPAADPQKKSSGPASPAGNPAPAAAAPAFDLAAVRKAAESGEPAAQVDLADAMLSGKVPGSKPEEAFKCLEKAADAGFAPGQFALARLLSIGIPGVKVDVERAKFLASQAAEAAFPPAQTLYGSFLEAEIDPRGRDLDYSEPLKWYRMAAEKGDIEAKARLGMMILNGKGLPAEPVKGRAMLAEAAQAGNPMALNEIGVCLQNGLAGARDETAAIGYFYAASELGNIAALVNLGSSYEQGRGVPRNFDLAGSFYSKAAKAGHASAQFALGRLFEEGLGTARNPVFAFVNYSRAAGRIPAAAARRELIRNILSKDQMAEAEKVLSGKSEAPTSGKSLQGM
ncbi:MAG: hypothetical protein JWL81_3084 [Verrucomicrobiales bacterium]|nr:hypothetical protein [Verrucomicrobiales bacterium]